MINIYEILKCLPHRYPMLLVDRILEVDPGKSCIGLKNVTINESFFQGHYPEMPIMPGVLIIEAMAQAGAVIILSDPKYTGQVPIIGSIEQVKFKRAVIPGDQLISKLELLWFRSGVGKMRGVASVGDQVACTVELMFKIVPRDSL